MQAVSGGDQTRQAAGCSSLQGHVVSHLMLCLRARMKTLSAKSKGISDLLAALVWGSSVWSGSGPFLPDRRPDSPVPDKIFGTGTVNRHGPSISVWSRSRPGPDGPCTIYFFIYSRLRTVGSCGMAQRPAAVGEPSAQHRTRNIAPTRAVAL